MGRDNPIIHREKLFGGRETAMELHRRIAWNNARCLGCGGVPVIQISVFVHLSDMSLRTQMAIEYEIAMKRIRKVALANGPGIRTSFVHACASCRRSAETQAARGPSYAIVHIDEGPKEDKPIVSVIAG